MRFAVGVAFVSALAMLGGVAQAPAADGGLVISQVYGGGGNTSATFMHDFVELYNPGSTAVPLDDLSIQYTSATGTGLFGANSTLHADLAGSIGPRRYYLVQLASGGSTGSVLPAVDRVDAIGPINMSATAGKVALVNGDASLGCNGGSDPCQPDELARIVDLVGYGNANFFEGAGAAPTLANDRSAHRGNGGCADTNNNAVDFSSAVPAPRNSATAAKFCDADLAPRVSSTTPANNASDVSVGANVSITFNEDVTAAAGAFSIACNSSGAHPAAVSGGPLTFTLDPATDFSANETCTVTTSAASISDSDDNDPPNTMEANHSFSFTTVAPTYRIHEIQGAGHISPLAGQRTSFVPGVVTAIRNNGFWMQDASPDSNPATSEGILVFTGSAPAVTVGQAVSVSGLITEFRPGGAASTNLTITELDRVTVYPAGPGAAIAPTVVGDGGRSIPTQTIEDDATGSVETSGTFDPAQDGIDAWETLESMYLQVNDAVATGPRNNFGEVFVVADGGAHAGPRTARGGVVVTPTDFNPERIQLDDVLKPTPAMHVGDSIPGATTGVLHYDFGNFELLIDKAVTAVSGGIEREVTTAPDVNELTIGTFNVENLDPSDTATVPRLAEIVVNNLRSPDLLGIEEVQDNNGGTNNGVVAADKSWQTIIDAIVAAGGPRYEYRQIDPVDGADGGQPGGNIRVGFLFRTDRGLAFVDRPGGDATTPTRVVRHGGRAELTLSPGRVDPLNPAWEATRKPLAGEFTWRGKTLIAIVNHFSSKTGDQPLFGRFQPPSRISEVARHQQAASVNAFVDRILAAEEKANVVVLGDINDFEFSQTTQILEGGVLTSLMHLLPQEQRYSYVFEGNSQVLDQVLFSDNLLRGLEEYDVVHVNAEFADQASDHDPSVARLKLLGAGGGGEERDDEEE